MHVLNVRQVIDFHALNRTWLIQFTRLMRAVLMRWFQK